MTTKIKNSKSENLQLPKDKKKKKILMSRGNYYDEEIPFQTLPNIQMVGMDVQIENVHNAFVQNLFKHIWLLVASMNVAKHKKMILDNGKFGKTFQSFYIDDKSEFGNLFEELKEDEKWVSKSYPTLNFSSNSFDIVNKYFTSERIERIKDLMVNVDKLKTRNNKTSKKLRDKIDVVSNNGNKIISDLQTSKKVNEVLENYCLIPIEKKNELLENNLLDDKEVKNIVTKKS
jgi:hypothetical protein